MDIAVSNTSPLLYLHRIGGLGWLASLFREVWVPHAVVSELEAGRQRGYDVPEVAEYAWIKQVNPTYTPQEWLSLELGPGELSAMALALEHREHVILLDDLLARKIAQAAGLEVWGTLRVLLEAKEQGLIAQVAPYVDALSRAGMWLSDNIRDRILKLAGEAR